MPRIAIAFDLDDLAERYLAGEGLEPLSIDAGIGFDTLKKALKSIGIEPRNRSAALKVRLGRAGKQGRKALTKAAHKAIREHGFSPEARHKIAIGRALCKSRKTSPLEAVLCKMLEARDLQPIPQEPVLTYNLDLGLAPIAVEVHASANNPTSDKKARKRIKHLVNAGWIPVYVWVTGGHPLAEGAADKILALYKLAKRDPTLVGQCRVIRGSGENAPVRVYGKEFAPIPPPEGFTYSGRFHHNISWEATP